MLDPKPAVLAVILVLGPGCRPSPCVSCRATLFRGAGIGTYLATHPAPDRVVTEADGGFTYTWVYVKDTLATAAPPTSPPPSPTAETDSHDYGSTLGGAATALLAMQSIKKKANQQPHAVSPARTVTVVTVRTDASRLVLHYTCESLTIPGGTSPGA